MVVAWGPCYGWCRRTRDGSWNSEFYHAGPWWFQMFFLFFRWYLNVFDTIIPFDKSIFLEMVFTPPMEPAFGVAHSPSPGGPGGCHGSFSGGCRMGQLRRHESLDASPLEHRSEDLCSIFRHWIETWGFWCERLSWMSWHHSDKPPQKLKSPNFWFEFMSGYLSNLTMALEMHRWDVDKTQDLHVLTVKAKRKKRRFSISAGLPPPALPFVHRSSGRPTNDLPNRWKCYFGGCYFGCAL